MSCLFSVALGSYVAYGQQQVCEKLTKDQSKIVKIAIGILSASWLPASLNLIGINDQSKPYFSAGLAIVSVINGYRENENRSLEALAGGIMLAVTSWFELPTLTPIIGFLGAQATYVVRDILG